MATKHFPVGVAPISPEQILAAPSGLPPGFEPVPAGAQRASAWPPPRQDGGRLTAPPPGVPPMPGPPPGAAQAPLPPGIPAAFGGPGLPGPAQLPPVGPPPPLTEQLVADDLIQQLDEQYGVNAPQLIELSLAAADFPPLVVTVRKRTAPDLVWALGVLGRKLRTGEDASLVTETEQREILCKQLASCRCVVKIRGKLVWDAFRYRERVLAVRPSWDGENPAMVPDFLQGVGAQAVYQVLARWHEELPFDLADKLGKAFAAPRVKPAATTPPAAEDPTSGA